MKSKQIQETIPSNWKIVSFSEIVEVSGGTTPDSTNPDYWNGDIPWLTPKDITKGTTVHIKKTGRKITQLGLENGPRNLNPVGCVLMSSRAPVGVPVINDIPMAVNQGFIVINCKSIDNHFLYYWIKNNVEYLKRVSNGTTFLELSKSNFKTLKISLPKNKEEQKKIAKPLYDLDIKIQNLQNQNQILEQIAQAIFKSWFVDFYGQTEFEDSELGQIPKGWKVEKLASICTTQYGYTESASDEEIGPKFLRVTDMNKQPWINWNDVPYCKITETNFKKYSLKQGDVVVSRMADPGKAGIMEEDTKAVFASYLVRLKTSSIIQSYFIFYFLRSTKYLDYAYGVSGSGSTRQNMNAKVITGVDLVIPSDETTKSFFKLIYPIRINIANNIHQINHLAKIRDTILPKLMSGEIRV